MERAAIPELARGPVPTRQLRRQRWRQRWRRLQGALPVVVWLLAIAAAAYLYDHVGVSGPITGFVDDRPVTLSHLEPGVVRQVHVRLYEDVARGRLLVSMDDREERANLAVLRTEIERLRTEVSAELARSEADNARAITDFEDLARRFAIDREDAHVDYLAQLAINARDRMLLHGDEVEYELVKALYDADNAPYRELNNAETELQAQRATVQKNESLAAEKKLVFEQADQRWAAYTQHSGLEISYDATLTPLRLAVDEGERQMEALILQIDNHVLRSPIDGQVTMLAAQAGGRVQAGIPLVAVSPTASEAVIAYVSESMAAAVHVGLPVSVRCLAAAPEGTHREYTGTVVSLSSTISEAPLRYRAMPNYPVWGRGMVISVEDGALLIPGEAVHIALLEAP